MIRCLFFDLGNVLINFSFEKACRQMAEVAKVQPEMVHDFLFKTGVQKNYETGLISTDVYHRSFEAFTGKKVAKDLLMDAGCNIFWNNEEAQEIVLRAKDKGYRLVLVSNTCDAHITYIRKNFKILGLFDELILSHEIRSMKPDARIFEAAIAVANCSPSECFFIDDIEMHVEGARKLGIQARQYTNVEKLKIDLKEAGIGL